MDLTLAQFYSTGFWTLAGVLATGIGMLFVFYRWVSSFVEKLGARIEKVDHAHAKKITELELDYAGKLSMLEKAQAERIRKVEKNLVTKEDCSVFATERSKPILLKIEHLKEGQNDLIRKFEGLTAKVGELAVNVAALVVTLNGKEKGK